MTTKENCVGAEALFANIEENTFDGVSPFFI
jgi:hypothetical protein